MITVEQLISPSTQPEEVQELLEFLQATGLDVGSLGEMDFGRAFIELLADAMARLRTNVVSSTVKNFYIDLARGIALTFLADGLFDVQRIKAVGTRLNITLTDDSGDGPHSITKSMAVVGNDALTYHFLANDTLPQSGSVTIEVECDTPGAIGNAANGTILALQDSISGVSVTNGISGGTSAITRLGTDYEKDPVLRQRCKSKPATYSGFSPRGAYENLVLSAVDGSGNPVGCTKVWVNASNPGGPGTVWVYIANQTATATSQQVTDTQAFIDDNRVSPCSIPTVIAATELPFDIRGVLYARRGYAASGLAAVTEAYRVHIEGTDDEEDDEIGLPLGGKQLDAIPGGAGYVLLSDLVDLAKNVTGIVDVILSTPGSNTAVAGNNLVKVGAITLEVVEI